MTMNHSPLSQLQKRLFAWGLSKANAADDHAIQIKDCQDYSTMAQLKRSLLGNLQGEVLEIGPGAGGNFRYYPTHIHWIGVEPNAFMSPYIHQESERLGLKHVELYEVTAETLPVGDHSIDTVVSTHVLCSVTDLDKTLQEIKRVLKPGGTFVFIEHVAAACGTWTRGIQDAIHPVWTIVFDQCHPNRETWTSLENADFANVSYQRCQLTFPIVSPHIFGTATTANFIDWSGECGGGAPTVESLHPSKQNRQITHHVSFTRLYWQTDSTRRFTLSTRAFTSGAKLSTPRNDIRIAQC
jgi:ubiquinone/menaquinone biosynthesis C-methylase UbiE